MFIQFKKLLFFNVFRSKIYRFANKKYLNLISQINDPFLKLYLITALNINYC